MGNETRIKERAAELRWDPESRGPFVLGFELDFPSPLLADENGLLAVGGDLAPERLIEAYRSGVFPWPVMGPDFPMLWWSPDPRFVLYPDDLRTSRSLQRTLRRGGYQVRFDGAFRSVISECAAAARSGQSGTWITEEMIEAYCELHRRGVAHSAETYLDGELVGGLYGVSLGGVFFGESMFSAASDASKVALVALIQRLSSSGFDFIDCQQETDHLERFGARPVPVETFLERLAASVDQEDLW